MQGVYSVRHGRRHAATMRYMSKRSISTPSAGVSTIGEASALLRALSNPNRLKIFLLLRDSAGVDGACNGDGICVGDICSELDIAPSTVSHHIRELELVGLVRTERSGKKVMLNATCGPLSNVIDFLSCEMPN